MHFCLVCNTFALPLEVFVPEWSFTFIISTGYWYIVQHTLKHHVYLPDSEAKEAKEAAVAAAATTEELELELEALDIAEDPLELEGPEETENEELAKKLLDEQGSRTMHPAVLNGGRCLRVPGFKLHDWSKQTRSERKVKACSSRFELACHQTFDWFASVTSQTLNTKRSYEEIQQHAMIECWCVVIFFLLFNLTTPKLQLPSRLLFFTTLHCISNRE